MQIEFVQNGLMLMVLKEHKVQFYNTVDFTKDKSYKNKFIKGQVIENRLSPDNLLTATLFREVDLRRFISSTGVIIKKRYQNSQYDSEYSLHARDVGESVVNIGIFLLSPHSYLLGVLGKHWVQIYSIHLTQTEKELGMEKIKLVDNLEAKMWY